MSATFSPDRAYRYTLERPVPQAFRFDARPFDGESVMFIGLNPSTADEETDDPTIRRLRGFALRWGFARMTMTNLFAFRATDPADMKRHPEPVGPDNDAHLAAVAAAADLVVCCWGNHGAHLGRSAAVVKLMEEFWPLHAFKLTGSGEPSHPLYLPSTAEPFIFKI